MCRSLLSFVIVIFAFVCAADLKCGDEFSEKRFLNNFNKLLDQRQLKITNGIVLRRKLTALQLHDDVKTKTCLNSSSALTVEFDRKFRNLLETHVLEFDFASLLSGMLC